MLALTGITIISGCSTSPFGSESFNSSPTWPMFGYDAGRTGFHPNTRGPTASPDVLWKTETRGDFLASPVVVGQSVYIGGRNSRLRVLDTTNGSERWHLDFGGAINTPVAFSEETIFAGTTGSQMYAVDATGGTAIFGMRFNTHRWTTSLGSSVLSAPAVKDKIVYVATVSGTLRAFDAATGMVKWDYPGGGKQFSAPAIGINRSYFNRPAQQGRLVALTIEKGKEVWSFAHGKETEATFSTPAVADGQVFFGSPDGNLYALDAESGEAHWTVETGSAITSSPVVTDEAVFVGNQHGQIYAIERQSGNQRWTVSLETGGQVRAAPAAAGGTLYVATTAGTIYAISIHNGSQRWKFDIGEDTYGGVVPLDSRLYVQTRGGTLYTLGNPVENK